MDFRDELIDFIDQHQNDKIYNSDVNKKFYDKVLEKKLNRKGTNVNAITHIDKLVQYYLSARMLDFYVLKHDIEDLVWNLVGFSRKKEFVDIFSEVEIEYPDHRIPKNYEIEYDSAYNKFYIIENGTSYEAVWDGQPVEHSLLDFKPSINGDCWGYFEYTTIAAPGSISINADWNIKAEVSYDKYKFKYELSNIKFIANYKLRGLSIVARYTGLHNSAWVCRSFLWDTGYSQQRMSTTSNKAWEGDPVNRGTIYIFDGQYAIASVKGRWDGYYNNISFDKLKYLLDKSQAFV